MARTPQDAERKRQEIVGAVAEHLIREGFANSGLRALAKSVGISDRMVMYYFETKEQLISEALMLLAQGFSSNLDGLLPERTVSGARIVEVLVASTMVESSRQILKLWFEIVGLGVRGNEPYRTVAGVFLSEWENWIEGKLEPKQKHRAVDLLAQIEGAVMIRLLRSDS